MISNSYSAPNYQSFAHNVPLKTTSDEILQTIAKGKISKAQKEKLEQQMGIRKNLTNKKKHSRNKKKYRQDAKFSSESEQQSYLKDDYIKSIMTNNCCFIEGSLLKLRTCNLVVYRDKGRFDLQVKVLTQQSHNIILTELFDPGFSKISIKKDKNQQQIIQYLKLSNKTYKYLVCWFQAVDDDKNQQLKQIARQANQRKRILGWQSDHVKSHIMSMRQFKQIKRFKCPQRVSSKSATCFNDERLLMIVQYPQKIQKIRQLYEPFKSIVKVTEEYYAIVPFCEGQTAEDRFALQNLPRFPKAIFNEITYQGWESNQPNCIQTQLQSKPQKSDRPTQPVTLPSPHDRITQIRLHFGFSQFEEILTDQQEQPIQDLATELLNSIKSLPIINPLMNSTIPPAFPSLSQTLFPGYNREYQPNPPIYPQRDSCWTNYPTQYYQNGQSFYSNYNYLPHRQNQAGSYPHYSQRKDYSHAPSAYSQPYRREERRYPINNHNPYNY